MKKLKYFVSIVLSLAMLAGVGAVTGCHKHTYDMNVWESVDDTYHWHPVSCGHKDQEGIDKTEHNYDSDFKCRDCGYRHEHTFSEEWTAQGKEGHYHASACGHDVKSALEPHDFDENLTCKQCNYVLEEAGIEVTKTTV